MKQGRRLRVWKFLRHVINFVFADIAKPPLVSVVHIVDSNGAVVYAREEKVEEAKRLEQRIFEDLIESDRVSFEAKYGIDKISPGQRGPR